MRKHLPSILLLFAFIIQASRLLNVIELPLLVAVFHSFKFEKIELSYLLVCIIGASLSFKPALLVCFIMTPYLLDVLFRKLVLPHSYLWLFIEILLKVMLAYVLVFTLNYFFTLSFPSITFIYEVITKSFLTSVLLFGIYLVYPNWKLESSKL